MPVTKEFARESLWRPGLSKQIEVVVTTCPTCCKHRQNHAEPMIASPLPERPWQKIATHHCYRLLFPNSTSDNVVNHLKPFFCRYGNRNILKAFFLNFRTSGVYTFNK